MKVTMGILGALLVVLAVCFFIMGLHPALGGSFLGVGLLLVWRALTTRSREAIQDDLAE